MSSSQTSAEQAFVDGKNATTKSYLDKYQACGSFDERLQLVQTVLDKENVLRETFAQEPTDPTVSDPFVSLIPAFQHREAFRHTDYDTTNPKFVFPLDDSEFAKNDHAVVDAATFRRSFDVFTENQLRSINWDNVFVAGGSVLACLMPVPEKFAGSNKDLRTYFHREEYPSSDIDLFLYGLTEEQANDKLRELYHAISENIPMKNIVVFRTKYAVSIVSEFPYRHIQIILRVYNSPAEVLAGFDVDSCSVGYDGTNVWTTPRAHNSLASRFNVVDISRRSPTYEKRLAKYAARGFSVYIPTLRRDLVDPMIAEGRTHGVFGLTKLLGLEAMTVNDSRYMVMAQVNKATRRPMYQADRARFRRLQEDPTQQESDYSSVHLPWGPGHSANEIKTLMYTKDQLLNSPIISPPLPGEPPRHRHVCFFGTLEEVMVDPCGTCPPIPVDPTKRDEDDEEEKEREEMYVSGPISWLVWNAGQQSRVGSFHPITEGDWSKGAYLDAAKDTIVGLIVDDDVEGLKKLRDESEVPINWDCKDELGRTPLMIAVLFNRIEIVRFLVQQGARLCERIMDGRTVAHFAAVHGTPEMFQVFEERGKVVNSLLDKYNAELKERQRKRTEHFDRLREEAAGSEDDEYCGADYYKRLHFINRRIEQEEAKAEAKEREAGYLDRWQLDSEDSLGMTALMYAAAAGKHLIVRTIIQECNVSIMKTMNNGSRASSILMLAASVNNGNNLATFRELLNGGALVNQKIQSRTILSTLCDWSPPSTTQLDAASVAKQLENIHQPVEDNSEEIPFRLGLLHELLQFDARRRAENDAGYDPLFLEPQVSGLNNGQPMTPLQLAVVRNNVPVVTLLIKHGAHVHLDEDVLRERVKDATRKWKLLRRYLGEKDVVDDKKKPVELLPEADIQRLVEGELRRRQQTDLLSRPLAQQINSLTYTLRSASREKIHPWLQPIVVAVTQNPSVEMLATLLQEKAVRDHVNELRSVSDSVSQNTFCSVLDTLHDALAIVEAKVAKLEQSMADTKSRSPLLTVAQYLDMLIAQTPEGTYHSFLLDQYKERKYPAPPAPLDSLEDIRHELHQKRIDALSEEREHLRRCVALLKEHGAERFMDMSFSNQDDEGEKMINAQQTRLVDLAKHDGENDDFDVDVLLLPKAIQSLSSMSVGFAYILPHPLGLQSITRYAQNAHNAAKNETIPTNLLPLYAKLFDAVVMNDVATVNELVDVNKRNQVDEYGQVTDTMVRASCETSHHDSPLDVALKLGHVEMVHALVEAAIQQYTPIPVLPPLAQLNSPNTSVVGMAANSRKLVATVNNLMNNASDSCTDANDLAALLEQFQEQNDENVAAEKEKGEEKLRRQADQLGFDSVEAMLAADTNMDEKEQEEMARVQLARDAKKLEELVNQLTKVGKDACYVSPQQFILQSAQLMRELIVDGHLEGADALLDVCDTHLISTYRNHHFASCTQLVSEPLVAALPKKTGGKAKKKKGKGGVIPSEYERKHPSQFVALSKFLLCHDAEHTFAQACEKDNLEVVKWFLDKLADEPKDELIGRPADYRTMKAYNFPVQRDQDGGVYHVRESTVLEVFNRAIHKDAKRVVRFLIETPFRYTPVDSDTGEVIPTSTATGSWVDNRYGLSVFGANLVSRDMQSAVGAAVRKANASMLTLLVDDMKKHKCAPSMIAAVLDCEWDPRVNTIPRKGYHQLEKQSLIGMLIGQTHGDMEGFITRLSEDPETADGACMERNADGTMTVLCKTFRIERYSRGVNTPLYVPESIQGCASIDITGETPDQTFNHKFGLNGQVNISGKYNRDARNVTLRLSIAPSDKNATASPEATLQVLLENGASTTYRYVRTHVEIRQPLVDEATGLPKRSDITTKQLKAIVEKHGITEFPIKDETMLFDIFADEQIPWMRGRETLDEGNVHIVPSFELCTPLLHEVVASQNVIFAKLLVKHARDKLDFTIVDKLNGTCFHTLMASRTQFEKSLEMLHVLLGVEVDPASEASSSTSRATKMMKRLSLSRKPCAGTAGKVTISLTDAQKESVKSALSVDGQGTVVYAAVGNQQGSTPYLRALLAAGADPTVPSRVGNLGMIYPLHCAAEANDPEAVELLLNCGAPLADLGLFTEDCLGRLPTDCAALALVKTSSFDAPDGSVMKLLQDAMKKANRSSSSSALKRLLYTAAKRRQANA